jgi:phosphoribosylaminoimidazolecarboxamide formyltransferase/IMP cyclohydrolase
MASKPIKSALVSVYHKEGLDDIIRMLHAHKVTIYSTGGSLDYIRSLGSEAIAVEDLTGYPSILDGRVKTLHPKVFGGILARREESHMAQLHQYDIPAIDLVIVDLYPFEETVRSTDDESAIIEKIDIGGISLIRAAAKNYADVLIVPSRDQYEAFQKLLINKGNTSDLEDRKFFATQAFNISSHYDTHIYQYFNRGNNGNSLSITSDHGIPLRYGENPHQHAIFFSSPNPVFQQLHGKELSYNNLVDVDAGLQLMQEFHDSGPTFAILKHTNACGVATRATILDAWKSALAGDPVSAFGGVLISNKTIDLSTAHEINEIFYEVLIAPTFDVDAIKLLSSKKNRILLKLDHNPESKQQVKSLLDGYIMQDMDLKTELPSDLKPATQRNPTEGEIHDLLFANKVVKHLKSNGIALVRDAQLIGMGCGQTSRVDALRQAITKAGAFGFQLNGAVMASEAFFPFPDCVQIAHEAGITAVIQPGGSVKDQESIDYCNQAGMAMVLTGFRHFKH